MSTHFQNTPALAPASFRRSVLYRFKGMKPKMKKLHQRRAVTEQGLGFPRRKNKTTNVLFKYMYRDASNYKQHGEALFSNHTFLVLDQLEQQIRACLNENETFIARQVHIEERFFDALYDDDHAWHEFQCVEIATLAPFDPAYWSEFQHHRDITEFIADLEKAHQAGWDEMNVRPDVKALLQHQRAKLKQKLTGEPPC